MDKRHGFAGGFPNSDLLNLQGFHIMSHTSFHMKNQNEKERKKGQFIQKEDMAPEGVVTLKNVDTFELK